MQQASDQYQGRCPQADARVTGHQNDQQRTTGHDRQRHDQTFTAAHVIDVGTENDGTQRTHQAAAEDAGSGVVTGSDRAQTVLVVEIAGQGAGQANETTERHAVEKHEPPAVTITQRLEVVRHGFGFAALRGVACHQGEGDQGQDQRDQRQAEDVAPTETGGQHRRDQRGQYSAGIARTGDAHGLALMLRWIPLRRQGQRDGERSTGHTEEHTQHQHLAVGVNAQLPGSQQRADDDHLADDSGGLGRQLVGQQAHEEAQHRTRQNRCGDHQATLLSGQLQVSGNLHRQRTKQVPDHETQVEIEKGREQGRFVACLPEACIHVHTSSSAS